MGFDSVVSVGGNSLHCGIGGVSSRNGIDSGLVLLCQYLRGSEIEIGLCSSSWVNWILGMDLFFFMVMMIRVA
jgi:hypothetical protein